MKIEQYKTVFGKNFKELDRSVKSEIDQGFQPWGNPYVASCHLQDFEEGPFICQAVVKGLNPMISTQVLPS